LDLIPLLFSRDEKGRIVRRFNKSLSSQERDLG
jgi:hypothetical protein